MVKPRQEPKAKVAVATVSPTKEDELTKQLKHQYHQIDTLVGQVKSFVSAVRATQAFSKGARPGAFGRQPQNTWREGSRGRGLPAQTQSQATLQPKARSPPARAGVGKSFRCWQCGEVGHLKHDCPL